MTSPRAKKAVKAWKPNWTPSHPGEHLAEILEHKGVSQAAFARKSGLSTKLLSTIINGRNPVTADSALKLARHTNYGPAMWLALQNQFDLFKARKRLRKVISK